ncbi:MAG: hypothetical protein ACI9CD_001224 [Candidatus Deianiraeaceae bacterium]
MAERALSHLQYMSKSIQEKFFVKPYEYKRQKKNIALNKFVTMAEVNKNTAIIFR